MTTSRQTNWMNHPVLRRLVDEANRLSLAERITLVKGLIPGIADHLTPREFDGFVAEISLKGERYHEAQANPGLGRDTRVIPGERELEGR
jgi:hypothetical protein